MTNEVIAFEGKQIKITKKEYDTFVASISTQNPTPEEINLHLFYCDSKGVNPLDKLIYFTKRQGRYTPITSIDFMRVRAESSGAYAGSDDAEFFYDKEKKLGIAYAKVTVWKMVGGQRCPFTATARWSEYAPTNLEDKAAFMWKKMPHTMLAKCAEALSLRKAFPGQLHGLYAREEMAQDGRYVELDGDENYSQDLKPEVVDAQADEVDQNYPKPESVKQAEELASGFTAKQFKNHAEHVVEIQKLTKKTMPEILAVINAIPDGEKRTIGQIVKELTGDSNGQ